MKEIMKMPQLNPHTDQKYIDALLSSNSTLHKEIYEKFSEKIKKLVLQNNGTIADAGDIFQEALLSIYKRAKQGNFILTCPFEAYLYAICRNKWLKELYKRKQLVVTFRDIEEYNNFEDGRDDITDAQQLRKELIEEKLAELSAGCRKILSLSFKGFTTNEIALMLNLSYGYVRKKKSESLYKLIEMVKNSPGYNSLKS